MIEHMNQLSFQYSGILNFRDKYSKRGVSIDYEPDIKKFVLRYKYDIKFALIIGFEGHIDGGFVLW